MTNTTLNKAVAAIRAAIETEAALENAKRNMRGAWATAYAATRTAQENGQTQADIGKAAKVSPATVGDMLTAATIHPVAWDALDSLPARQGVRFTSLHSLVAGARKTSGTPAVREIIAGAVAKVRDIPREDGAEPDPERVAKVWGAAIRKLWDASAKKAAPKATTEPSETTQPVESETVQATEPEPPTLDARVLRLAGDCEAIRQAIHGGGTVERASLAALQREAAQLARDIAAMLAPSTKAATA